MNDDIKKKIIAIGGKLREKFHEEDFCKYHRQWTNE